MDPKKKKRRLQEFGVGVVVIIGLALLAGGILSIGRENRLFVSKVDFVTIVPDASGLQIGSAVTMDGIRIGTLERMVLPTDPRSRGIRLYLSVDRSFAARVREGTAATLSTVQIVANEKVVALTPGDPAKPPLREGSVIPNKSTEGTLMAAGQNIAQTVEQVTTDLRDILDSIRKGQGLLGKAIVDPLFAREEMDKLSQAVATTTALLERVDRGQGLVGKFLADRAYSEKVSGDLARAAAAISDTAQRLDKGEGLLGKMTRGGPGDDVLANLSETTRNLRDVSAAIRNGDGFAGELLSDKVRANRVAANLDEAAANLASITRKVNEGQGTLGLLVNSRDLHDDAEQVITGVHRSKLVSWFIHHFYRKGETESDNSEQRPTSSIPNQQPVNRAGDGAGNQAAGAAYSAPSAATAGAAPPPPGGGERAPDDGGGTSAGQARR